MNEKILIGLLAAATLAAVALQPEGGRGVHQGTPGTAVQKVASSPAIDAVFVLDTTGSMSGLIQTAKEKIWSIASTMGSAEVAPTLRIGLVAFRDRGDDYVIERTDLSGDLDSVYARLMQLEAGGGGDGPESVNAALASAVDRMSWSDTSNAYRAVFLVGDSPPHMDYADEERYPAILARARQQGIVVNAIQCGSQAATVAPWSDIARLGGGQYFQVEQGGGAISMQSPYDSELAELSARLDRTRVFFGTPEEREAMDAREEYATSIAAAAPAAAKAQRGLFNLTSTGKSSLLGQKELVDAVATGSVDLDELDDAELPAALREMTASERKARIDALVAERADIESSMRALAEQRDAWVRSELETRGGGEESLEQKLYDTVAEQAKVAGLVYEEGPAY